MTLGVIGGCGPAVGAWFYARLVELTDAARDGDHPDLILSGVASIPDRSAYLLGKSEKSPVPALSSVVRRLEAAGADCLMLLCHTAHAFLPELRAATALPFLDLVSLSVDFAATLGVRRLGILASEGTCHARLYDLAAAARRLSVVYPSPYRRAALHRWIYEGLKGGASVSFSPLLDACEELAHAGCEAVLLACTELSLPAARPDRPLPILSIDPLELLARRAILISGKKVKEESLHAACRSTFSLAGRSLADG